MMSMPVIAYYDDAGEAPGLGHSWDGVSTIAMDLQNPARGLLVGLRESGEAETLCLCKRF
jgi:hypothetical protein